MPIFRKFLKLYFVVALGVLPCSEAISSECYNDLPRNLLVSQDINPQSKAEFDKIKEKRKSIPLLQSYCRFWYGCGSSISNVLFPVAFIEFLSDAFDYYEEKHGKPFKYAKEHGKGITGILEYDNFGLYMDDFFFDEGKIPIMNFSEGRHDLPLDLPPRAFDGFEFALHGNRLNFFSIANVTEESEPEPFKCLLANTIAMSNYHLKAMPDRFFSGITTTNKENGHTTDLKTSILLNLPNVESLGKDVLDGVETRVLFFLAPKLKQSLPSNFVTKVKGLKTLVILENTKLPTDFDFSGEIKFTNLNWSDLVNCNDLGRCGYKKEFNDLL